MNCPPAKAFLLGVVIWLPLGAAAAGREQPKIAKNYLPASVVAWPGATCSLHPEGSMNPAEAIPVFADDDGVARFYAVRATSADATRRLSLDCRDDDGRAATYPVDLESGFTFKTAEPMVAPSSASLRPELVGDPQQYSQSELLEAGYGLQPDAVRSPEAYAHWLRGASQPLQVVKTKPRELPVGFTSRPPGPPNPCIICRPPTTTTVWDQMWGGPALLGGLFTPTFTFATAEIQVPRAIPGGDGTVNANGAMWIGVGGDSNNATPNPLIQSGVVILTSPSAASYITFVQYWPAQLNATGLFQVNPGDVIFSQAWACDSSGNVNASGAYGCFFLWDENTGKMQSCNSFSSSCHPVAGTGGFNGSTAEFIFEKPPQSAYLPDYFCCAIMSNAGAKDSQGAWHDFSTDNIDLFQLYGFGTGSFKQLEFVNILSAQQVQFSFNERSGGH